MRQARPGHPARVAYKFQCSLFPAEWDELRMEAQARGITGAELIGAILSQYVHAMGPHDRVPPPDDPPEDT